MGRECIRYAVRNLTPVHFDHVLEFGVCRGASIKIIKEELDRKKEKYNIFGFDSFIGLPEDWVGTGLKKGYFSTDGKIPNIDGIKFFKGWFKDTIPEYLKIAKDIALLHVDCDVYSSTIDVLYGVQDFVVEGTIIVFDDWFYNHDPKYNDGNQKAFYEWIKDFKRDYRFIDFPGHGNPGVEHKILEVK
jgi:hypothetical protein